MDLINVYVKKGTAKFAEIRRAERCRSMQTFGDLVKSFLASYLVCSMSLQKSASIQPRTSLSKFAKISQKLEQQLEKTKAAHNAQLNAEFDLQDRWAEASARITAGWNIQMGPFLFPERLARFSKRCSLRSF